MLAKHTKNPGLKKLLSSLYTTDLNPQLSLKILKIALEFDQISNQLDMVASKAVEGESKTKKAAKEAADNTELEAALEIDHKLPTLVIQDILLLPNISPAAIKLLVDVGLAAI